MKYVRIVVAVEDDKLEHLDDYLTCFIETDVIPDEFRVDDRGRPALLDSVWAANPIQGAYVSVSYDDRNDALGGDWNGKDAADAITSTPDTVYVKLDRNDAAALAEFVDDELGETGLDPDDDRFGLFALQSALRESGVAT